MLKKHKHLSAACAIQFFCVWVCLKDFRIIVFLGYLNKVIHSYIQIFFCKMFVIESFLANIMKKKGKKYNYFFRCTLFTLVFIFQYNLVFKKKILVCLREARNKIFFQWSTLRDHSQGGGVKAGPLNKNNLFEIFFPNPITTKLEGEWGLRVKA